ncbi:MAG: hypothetical protein AB1530_00740 [Candidatus Omnitrophota bacterium]
MSEKTIKDLDINRIEEKHLIILEKDFILYRRTAKNPLAFQHSSTTFTTAAPIEKQGFYLTYHPTAASYATTRMHTVFKETEDYVGNVRLYQLKVIHKIARILDLNQVCNEQGIERDYLRPDQYFRTEKEQSDFEHELYRLYMKELNNKKIYGVKFKSRKDPEGDCIVFYDNLPHRSIIKKQLCNNTEKTLIKILNLTNKVSFLHAKLQKLFSKMMFFLNGYTISEYVFCEDITDNVVKVDGTNQELLKKINKHPIFL